MMRDAAPDTAEVAAALADGALLLTATSALALDWKRRLVADRKDAVVATPRVQDWSSWLRDLAGLITSMPVPLDAMQEAWLWERVIRTDSPAHASSARGLAGHAASAYALMREHHVDVGELAGGGDEAEALARWIAGVQTEVSRMGRILTADLTGMLTPSLPQRPLPSRILFDGFACFSPVQEGIVRALEQAGVALLRLHANGQAARVRLTACTDPGSEYRHAARKIAELLAGDPSARIAVVTSRQVSDARVLRRVLDETLLPKAAMGTDMQAAVMAGEPLSSEPLVGQMLRLLQLAGMQGAPFADISPLLFSPGLKGFASEQVARARLDAELRERNRHYVGFKALSTLKAMQELPALTEVLGVLGSWGREARPAGEWVRAVHTLLQAVGYLAPDVPGRSSHAIRVLNAFRESLASLASLDAVAGAMDWNAFRAQLGSVCRATPMPAKALFPNLSVIPLSRIPGLRFDAVFALGFDEEALPLPAMPVPLLPFAVQRKHALPCSSASLAFDESTRLWQALLDAAPEVRVSWARRIEQRELSATPLAAGIEMREQLTEPDVATRVECEAYDDAPDVPLEAAETVRGGSGILRDQSACPFRAFAGYRLGIAPLGETAPGIEAKDKGSLLHAALEYIWTQIRSQVELLALDDAAQAALIGAAVEHACEVAHVALPGAARQVERQRMCAVLSAWLAIERERPSFKVEACEQAWQLSLPAGRDPGLTLRLKADRIDRDAEGRRILIDYKSGRKQSVSEWTGERMREPQLPLYALAGGLGEQDAVCFARLRSGDMGFEGLSGEDTGIDGIAVCDGKRNRPEDWGELLAEWHEEIDRLAAEFVAGRSTVMPRDAAACTYCGLQAVCRIDEIGFADADDDDSAGGESA